MLCPRCKKEIEDNSLKCSFCNTKVGSLCSVCGSYNLITARQCDSCGNVLLKICSECGSANLPTARKCRKCQHDFTATSRPTSQEVVIPTYSTSMNSQQKVKAKLIEGIKDADSRIITIAGESGVGKNLILRYTISELKTSNIVWLLGSCSQITQLSPFGYFQDLLLTFFNINNFCPDTLQLKKGSMKFFKEDFPTLTNSEILDLLNLLYPENVDKYENIYFNKAKMFLILKKVIFTIIEKMKIIFIIDNFELIDGMSYDFLKELIKEDIVRERAKFIFICTEPKPGLGILAHKDFTTDSYLDLAIAPFSESQADTFLKQHMNTKFRKDFVQSAIKISNGNPSIIEQMVYLDNEINKYSLKNPVYNSVETIIRLRLSILKKNDYQAYRMLIAMSVLGANFYPAMLENFDNNQPAEFERIIEKLVNDGYLNQQNNLVFEFKSKTIWSQIVSIVKNDDCFEEILNMLYEILKIYKQSSIALLGYIIQKLNNNDQAFDVWTLLMKQASYIGDIGLYIISQKQCLKLIENKTSPHYTQIKKNIYTRVGKLLEPIDWNTAFDYLQKAIMMLDDDADAEHVELLGYLASCSMKLGNYCGAIECVESVLNKISPEMSVERILIKTKLVKPYLKLGNYGQLINLVETEILDSIEKILAKGKDTPIIKLKDLYEIWLNLYFDYAEALVFQGDSRAFNVIQTIDEILEKNRTTEPNYISKTYLLLALAHTVKGDINTSKKILEDILKEFSLDSIDVNLVSRWNFIDMLNKFFTKDYASLYSELFNAAAYANNINDDFTKNLLKTILAKILKDNNQTKKALEILEEQVSYFAKEKISTGVLLSWLLIAEIKLITSGTQFALDIATKALDIAQGPNINNYYFIALFNKLLGEIYLAKQDFDSAKVYIEKSIVISKQFDMQFILVKSYLEAARLYQELALPKTSLRSNYIKQALKMFQLAKNVPIVTTELSLQKRIKEDLNILTSFCRLNGIILKKDAK